MWKICGTHNPGHITSYRIYEKIRFWMTLSVKIKFMKWIVNDAYHFNWNEIYAITLFKERQVGLE